MRVRRLACRDRRCPRRTFREQVCGVLERYQRRTVRLSAQVGAVVRELAGRASARVFLALGVQLSRHAALRALLGIPLPAVATPRVLGVDDFSLRRSRTYATVLRKRRAEEPAVPVLQLLGEIRQRGYTGSQNLLYRYITQGRVEDDRPALSPRRLSRLLLTRPDTLRADQQELLYKTTNACPEMNQLAALVRIFAQLLTPADDNGDRLEKWISTAVEANLPHVHSFVRGLRLDQDAVRAALTSEYHNGGTEGVNTKTKLIKRQMYGRAGFDLLRHRILLQ
jgi:hypothetical protein